MFAPRKHLVHKTHTVHIHSIELASAHCCCIQHFKKGVCVQFALTQVSGHKLKFWDGSVLGVIRCEGGRRCTLFVSPHAAVYDFGAYLTSTLA